MVLRPRALEVLIFLIVIICMAKVLVIMSYLDSSKEGLLGQAYLKGTSVFGVQDGYVRFTPKVRSILQENKYFLSENHARKGAEANKEEVYENKEETSNEADLARINADLFAKLLKRKYEHSTKCSEKSVFLLALIQSNSENLEIRMTIRETWANALDAETLGVLAMFVLGKPKERPELEASVKEENERFDDIILGNFLEDFRNSSLKTLTGFEWVSSHCSSAKFVFMGDDNLYLHMEKIMRSLRSLHTKDADGSMWRGRIRTTSKAIRDVSSRFYVSKRLFDRPIYPPFCTLEAGFVLSMPAVLQIYRESFHRSIVPFGDVLIGIIAEDLKWNIIEDDLFNYRDYEQNICDLHKVVTLRGFAKPDEIRSAFEKMHNDTFLRNCPDPDLDLVLPSDPDNGPYLDKILKMIHDHPKYCYNYQGQKEDVFIISLISSLPRHFESRQAIRETWGGQQEVLGERIKILFLMGLTQQDTEEIQRQVQAEDKEHGDIIQASFQESFQNLTLKVVLGLKWVSENCAHATYVYKGDDDMFVNFPNIINFIKKSRRSDKAAEKYFTGSVLSHSVRIKTQNSKYFVNESVYSGRFYPPYCSGGGYVLSSDIVPPMYQQALKTAFIPIDDAYQGILAKKIGVVPQYNGGFKNWGEKSDACYLRTEELMTIHGFGDPQAMRQVWRNFTDTSVVCREE